MAMATKNFYGEIDGETIQGLYRYLDKSANTVEERIQKVCDLLYKDEDHTQLKEIIISVFDDNRVNIHPSHKDSTLSESNVCQLLEACGTYILFSADSNEVLNYPKGEKIVVLDNYKMSKDESRNISYDSLLGDSDGDFESILTVERNERNYKKQIKQKIKSSDYSDGYAGEVLSQYEELVDAIKGEIANLRALCEKGCDNLNYVDAKNKIRRLSHMISEIRYDMIQTKDQIRKTIYFKAITPNMPISNERWFDLEHFDYWDSGVIKLLALVDEPQTEYCKKYLDKFEKAYISLKNSAEMSDRDILIIDTFRSSGDMYNLAHSLGMTYQNVYAYVPRLLLQIQRQMIEDYELDEYYLDKVKGDWKKCSKCGKSYPRNQYYWNRAKTGKDGFRGECKKCERNRLKNR